jgi:hypothetical protein
MRSSLICCRNLICALSLTVIVIVSIAGNTQAVCGDVSGDGWVTMSDPSFLIAYLLGNIGSVPSTYDANTDGTGSITNNDAEVLMAYIFLGGASPFCAPISANNPFPSSSDTLQFRNVLVPSGQATCTVELWLKATGSYYGLAVPFAFSCATSSITLTSVTNLPSGGASRIDAGLGRALIQLNAGGSPYPSGTQRIASLNFSLGSTGQENLILLSDTEYAPSHIVVISKYDGFFMSGYTPAITDDRPQFEPLASVAAAPAQIVSFATADLDMDTYTDVVFMGETREGLFVAWGQAGDPPIGAPDSVAAIANADMKVFHLNSDTIPDLVAVTSNWVYSLVNNGDRTFTVDSVANTTSDKVAGSASQAYGTFPHIALGFFDTDASPDLLVTPDKIFSGDGSGSFTTNPALGFSFETVDVSDFNDDGTDDLVAVGSGSATVYLNDGTGSFTSSGSVGLGLADYDLMSVVGNVDIDRDGFVDIVASVAKNVGANDTTIVTLASGDGLGGLTLADTVRVLGTAPQVSVSDVNRDYWQDLVISDASTGRLLIRYNDGSHSFNDADEVLIGVADDLRFALASADLDRNGQPDFVSGSAAGDSLIMALNNLPDEPVLPDEMFVTGYDYVDVTITNPLGFVISRTLQTVAGSAYYRLLVDPDTLLDTRTYDYNLQYGLYNIKGRIRPGSGGDPVVSMGIGIDGSAQRTVYLGYTGPTKRLATSGEQTKVYEFDYEVESDPSMQPGNGIPTDNRLPTFQWQKRVTGEPSGTVYRFELDEYHDFSSSLRMEAGPLTMAQYVAMSALGMDSVYYWRYLTSHNGGASYPDTSLTFAAYISRSCCQGRVGDVNGQGGDEPTISDISTLIDYLFISNSPLQCYQEADVDQSGGPNPAPKDITIGDISRLIDYLFITGPSLGLPSCL